MQLARLHAFTSTHPVVSLYLNRADVPPRGVAASLEDLIKPHRELRFDDRDAAMSLRRGLEWIAAQADRIEADPARSVALFACGAEDLFEYVSLPSKAWDVSVVDRRPYLRPFRYATTRYLSAAVVVEARRSVVFCGGDDWEEYGEVVEEGVRKKNYGGFSGYAEHNVRQHAEEAWQKHLKETADLVFSLFQERNFDFLFVGGHKEQVDDFVEVLHPYVKERVAGEFIVDPRTMTSSEVRDTVRALEQQARRGRELDEVRGIYDTAASGGLAVVGLPASLAAANARAVERLVVVGTYLKPGTVCPSCGFLGLDDEVCPACGATMSESADVVNELAESVVEASGSFLQVVDDGSEAIGATIRFPIST